MRFAEIFITIPWFYLLIAVRAFLPLQISPVTAFLLVVSVIGIVGWSRPARLVRGVILSARERNFVLAARGFGASNAYLLATAPDATDVPRAAYADGRVDSAVHSGGSHPVIPWPGDRRAISQLGQYAGPGAAISRPGFLLVDALARTGARSGISGVSLIGGDVTGADKIKHLIQHKSPDFLRLRRCSLVGCHRTLAASCGRASHCHSGRPSAYHF